MIWFGRNQYSPIVKKCISSWKIYCPEYKIKIWNEDNFNINSNQYVKEAYEAGKWAFVSDYVRLYVLFHIGGVYIDSDVELIKNIDNLLNNEHVVTGYSSSEWIPAGLMASEPGNCWIKRLLEYYDNRHFLLSSGKYDMTINNKIITDISRKQFGFKTGDLWIEYGNVKLYPQIYFHPFTKHVVNWEKEDITNVKKLYKIDLQKTFCVHYGTGSWVDNRNTLPYKIKHLVRLCLPQFLIQPLERFYYKHHNWKTKSR